MGELAIRITPFNEAEAILDAFWDSTLSELSLWEIAPGEAHGLVIKQSWCFVQFEWARKPATGPALRMQRNCSIDCSQYDHLVLSVMVPINILVRLIAQTSTGMVQSEFKNQSNKKIEMTLDLRGASRLDSVTIELEASHDGITQGWFNWLGLLSSSRRQNKIQTQSKWDSRWEKYLKDESYEPSYKPSYGLMLTNDELNHLRDRHAQLTADGSPSPFVTAGRSAGEIPPENLIHDYVNFWGDSRYNRQRDHDKFILNHGLNAAIAGHLLRDKTLLRLAARYAMSLGMCGKWEDGFICDFPGSTFDHRCFVQSLCAYEVAAILDLAGEFFTDLGRDYLLRRLGESIGAIQFQTWKYEYIFNCNQLSWFSPGRMLALAVLDKHMLRVRPQLEMAYRELCENIDRTILNDGSYAEGPTYFRCVGRDAVLGLHFYSRAIGRSMNELIPKTINKCGQFAEALHSTDDDIDLIPICDAWNRHEIISQSFLATLHPQSAWHSILKKTIRRNHGWPVGFTHVTWVPSMSDCAIAWNLIEKLPDFDHHPKSIVHLPTMGPLVSHRKLDGQIVKLLIQGNKSNTGHAHEDKGSFVLEFAGQTFAMDPGSCDYSDPLASILKNCERHNMLVPFGTALRPCPANPLPYDVYPVGHGDEKEFHASIDATPGWEKYYRHWKRSWNSSDPATLTIDDQWELIEGQGVEWYWQTQRAVTVEKQTITLHGTRARIQLHAPDHTTIRIDTLAHFRDQTQTRITLICPHKFGRIIIPITLDPHASAT